MTDTAGEYVLSGIPPGSYQVRQDQGPDWIQSLPSAYGEYGITVTSGYDSASFDFGNFLSPAGSFAVTAGWNLLSLPVLMDTPLAGSLYPSALSPVYTYDTGYVSVDTVPNGRGYWVKFPASGNIFLPGFARTTDTLDLVPGWNLIGTLSGPVQLPSLTQEPDTLVESKFFGFSGTAYSPLPPDGTLMPHRGYWVKCRVAGRLILTETPPGNR